jgi:hypothetical protein
MQITHNLNGRRETRLHIALVVRLPRVPHLPTKDEERTYTDNFSPHGARVFSRRSWQLGEKAEVTPLKEESPICGEVMYCQTIDVDRFCIGLKFQKRSITWPILSRYCS